MLFTPRYVKENGGIDTEDGYPYPCHKSCCYDKAFVGATCSGKHRVCRSIPMMNELLKNLPYRRHMISILSVLIGYVDIKRGSEIALQFAVAEVGPISVIIDASHESFQFYRSGVYNEP